MEVLRLTFLFLQMHAIFMVKPRKRKGRVKNFNSPFYLTKFDGCKPYRELSPVEVMKARSYSARYLSHCGTKFVLDHMGNISFPGAGILGLTNVICLGGTITYAYFSEDETVTVPASTLSNDIFKMITMFPDALKVLNYSITLRHKDPKVILSPDALMTLIYGIAACFLDTEFVPQVDFDYIKYAVHRFRYILL